MLSVRFAADEGRLISDRCWFLSNGVFGCHQVMMFLPIARGVARQRRHLAESDPASVAKYARLRFVLKANE